jgi:hypothetical protein
LFLPRESDLENDFAKWVKLNGGECIKFTPLGSVGWPDRIVLLPGVFIWVELKRAGKEPTSMQYYRLATIRQLGHSAIWGSNMESLTNQIGAICKTNNLTLSHGNLATKSNRTKSKQ